MNMKRYSAIIGADLRAYSRIEFEAQSDNEAIARAQTIFHAEKNDLEWDDISYVDPLRPSIVWITNENGEDVAEADGLDFFANERERLEDAADDLLLACSMVLDADGDLDAVDFDMIRRAIAKAKGGAA